jgi:thiamine biosynthesis lipoprotein
VSVESPQHDCALAPVRIALHGLSVATSGDYRRWFDDHGQRRSHTLDPRTRRPVTHATASVTVLHERCALADAWSTALMVLGVDDGLPLASRHGLAVLWIERDGEAWRETWSPAALALLE